MELIADNHILPSWGERRIRLRGDLTASTIRVLETLRPLVASGPATLTLDMDGVNVLDFGGLGGLIKLLRYARERGGSVLIETSNEHIRKVLDQTALSRIFKLRPTAKAA